MPVVRIELLPGRSDEVKQALVDRITAAFQDVCGIDPAQLDVIFHTVDRSDWFVAGKSFAARQPAPAQSKRE